MERFSSTDNDLIEQVPHYTVAILDDGSFERLRLIVELPGVESSAGLHVEIEGSRAFVHLPGKYRLDVPLGVTVADTAITLKFVKNRQYLKAEYKVLERSVPAPSAAPQRPKPPRTPSPPLTHAQSGDACSPRTTPNGLHNSFMADAVKLRDAWRSNAQGSKSHNGPGAAKHSGRARPSARSGNDGAAEQEEPRLNGHKTPQANGWQRGFLNRTSSSNGDEADGSGAAARYAVPKHSQAHSSGDSSSEQWEPDGPSAADQEEARPGREDAGSNLYETAKLLSNREAAAECISKAEEALAGADFDKAERLFQKAERLAPDLYSDVTQTVEQERIAHEAQKAAKKREEREAAKRRKREEERRKKEEQQKRQMEEQQQERAQEELRRRLSEEQKRKADAARAAAAEEAARRQGRTSSRGESEDDEDPIYEEDYNWGYLQFGYYFKVCISILYALLGYVLCRLGAPGAVYWMQKKRHGSRRQRTSIGCLVLGAWALAIYTLFAYGPFCLRCIWSCWCFIFWRPPLTAAIIETCIFGLLCCIMPGLSSLIGVPMMWHWVGGGFSAMHGTVACFLFVVHVDGWLEGTPPLVRKFSFAYRLASPLLYARAVLSLRGWLELLVFLGIDAWVYSAFTSPSSADDDTGMAAGSESCRPEAVPKGAAPEVARVLQASSWYAVLDVAQSASTEEVRKAHKAKSLVTHPDKLGAQNSGAHEASVRVNTARDVLADAQKRAAYDAELRATAAASLRNAPPPQSPPGHSSGDAPGFFTEFSGRREPCGRASEHSHDCVCMPCKACSQWHHVYVTTRARTSAYWCNSCSRSHPGINKHVWKETTSAGFFSTGTTKVYLYALGLTLDITDITDSCEFWSWLARKATGPSCLSALKFQGELPIREECFAAYRQQEAPADPRRSNNKRKGGRRRR